MTQSKELKQVRDALDKLEDANYGVPTTSEDSLHRDLAIANAVYEIRATLDRLSAPVGVKKIEGIGTALECETVEHDIVCFELYKKYPTDIFREAARAWKDPSKLDHALDNDELTDAYNKAKKVNENGNA